MKCIIVMDDWRKLGEIKSIYSTPLGMELSKGDLHSGTTFDANIDLPEYIEQEIKEAMEKHGAYPSFWLMA